MSQSGPLNENAISPTIATQYTTDSGIAIPAANNLNVFSTYITPPRQFWEQGIETFGAGDTVSIAIRNRFTAQGNTTGGGGNITNTSGVFFSADPPGLYNIECQISCYDPVNLRGASFQLFSCGLWDGAAGTILGTPTVISNVSVGLEDAYVDLEVIGGAFFLVVCHGVVGVFLDWRGVGNWTLVN